MVKHAFIIHNQWALGDTVCLSALARDIQLTYPGQYDIFMSGHYHRVFWHNNPYCKPAFDSPSGQIVRMEYSTGIQRAGRGFKSHFLSYFHQAFEKVTGVRVPVTLPYGDIHLNVEEKAKRFVPGRYWVVVAGGKRDMTAKIWYTHRFQEVVNTLAAHGIECVQAGANFTRNYHPKLANCVSLVGKTDNERDFFSLLYHADGVICGVTAAMHIAAAFKKPCVVVAGGREEPWWEAYTNAYMPESFGPTCAPVPVEHAFLHTVGLLDCGIGNMVKGCWRNRTVPIDSDDIVNTTKRNALCKKPRRDGLQAMPECMAMIETAHVVEAVMNYYEKGILPPIGKPSGRYSLPVTNLPINGMQLGLPPELTVPSRTLSELPTNSQWLPDEVKARPDEDPDIKLLDHPFIGGRFTTFVLGYGEHHALVQRCISSILKYGADRVDLRVALNQPNQKMLDYIKAFPPSVISKVYLDRGSRRKYPAMREMFWDESHPITSKYIMWFDDDSHVVDPKWLVKLGQAIIDNHRQGFRMYGPRYIHDLAEARREGKLADKWFKSARWWRDQWLHMDSGRRQSPNGSQIVFASGGFWALATEVIKLADIPDTRLNHNGGDITLGAQLAQAGFKMFNFTPKPKKIVCWSDYKRRGFHETFPWQRPA